MDERIPVRMSKHGYPVYEQSWKQEINTYIIYEGIEAALERYTEEEVLHHLGGKAYGAEIGSDHIIFVEHFDNNNKVSWSMVEPILDMLKEVKSVELVGTVLTKSTMILQYKMHRIRYSNIISRVNIILWDSRMIEQLSILKNQPLSESLVSKLPTVTDDELKGWGFTDPEVAEFKIKIADTGFTHDEILKGNLILTLVHNELNKIGIQRREVEI